jgi:maleylpyruvate isomerase
VSENDPAVADLQLLERRLRWARLGTERLREILPFLAGSDPAAPSLLPGWTRAHVLAHLDQNATALGNLLTWARTGIPTPMYRSPQDRDRAIEQGSRLPADVLIEAVRKSADLLGASMDALPARSWRSIVASGLGRRIPAAEVPWLRAREVWVHAVDLRAGAEFAAFPVDLGRELIIDVARTLGSKLSASGVVLSATDTAVEIAVGPQPPRSRVSGTTADLLAWLTRRQAGALAVDNGELPEMPRWI